MEPWQKLAMYRKYIAAHKQKRRTSGYVTMFQRWIRNLIHEMEFTSKEAANFFGITRMTLNNWIQGVCSPNWKSLEKIRETLGYDWKDMEEILRNGRRS